MPQFRLFAWCLLLCSGWTADGQAAEAVPQVVVLRNGNVLWGTVEKLGDHLRVVSAGSEVRLRSADVDLVCESVEAAYQQLRARVTPPTAVGHMQVATWCVRQELWAAAQTELAAARQLEPNHPRLAILEQTAAHLQRVAESQSATPARAAGEPANRPNQSANPPTAGGDLLAELPEEALEDFTRRVQPILVNNCTTSGCHRVDGPQQFQLNRDLLHGMANRRSTLRNLTAALNVVNADAPLESVLLERANSAHAGMEMPPLPVHQRELHKRLEDWVLLVSGKKPPEPTPPDEVVQLAVSGVVPASGTSPPNDEQGVIAADLETEALFVPPQPQPPRVGVQLRAWAPRDEFDPEIFNRLQAAPEKTTEPGTAKN